MAESRTALRKMLHQRRQTSHEQHAAQCSANVVTVMRQQGWLRQGHRGAAYVSFRSEVDTSGLIDAARGAGCELALPRVMGDDMVFLSCDVTASMDVSPLGIEEPPYSESNVVAPSLFDWVLMPLLGFDRCGNRLGYGGGYYDRALSAIHAKPHADKPVLIGVAYSAQEVDRIPAESWDVPLDYVITESGLITC